MAFTARFRCIAGCAGSYPLDQVIYRCPTCGDLLEVVHDMDALRTKTAAEWTAFFADKDCLVEVVLELDELSEHPLHKARSVFFEIDGGPNIGRIRQIRTPVGTPTRPILPPRLGEHTREVLAEYGLSESEITALG